jgi:iron complex transport system substrate-binding protein
VRIASLVASATEIVAFLGLEEQLVGVSADSDWPSDVVRGLPVLNTIAFNPETMSSAEIDAAASSGHTGASLYHVDGELLRNLHPDLVLTQEICDVCSVSRHDVDRAAELLGYTPRMLSLNAVNLEEVFADIQLVAQEAGVADRAQARVASLRQRVERVRGHHRWDCQIRSQPPRVLSLEWLDPPYSAGHWIPRMVALAGGQEVLGNDGGPSREIMFEDVLESAPDVIVLMPCSLQLERVAAEFPQLRERPGWQDLPAAINRRVFAGHTDLFARAGPRLVDGVEALARMLDPHCFSDALPEKVALKVSHDGTRLEPFR